MKVTLLSSIPTLLRGLGGLVMCPGYFSKNSYYAPLLKLSIDNSLTPKLTVSKVPFMHVILAYLFFFKKKSYIVVLSLLRMVPVIQ